MPKNRGSKPRASLVDIRLRNGMIIRSVDPDKWRWKQWPEGEHAFDIVDYQPAQK